ncbi:unnamed protein product [Urochloa humidicola]
MAAAASTRHSQDMVAVAGTTEATGSHAGASGVRITRQPQIRVRRLGPTAGQGLGAAGVTLVPGEAVAEGCAATAGLPTAPGSTPTWLSGGRGSGESRQLASRVKVAPSGTPAVRAPVTAEGTTGLRRGGSRLISLTVGAMTFIFLRGCAQALTRLGVATRLGNKIVHTRRLL